MAKKRFLNPFGLSFLDVMSCGFGAAVLVFMLIKHNSAELAVADSSGANNDTQIQQKENLMGSVEQLEGRSYKLAQKISGTEEVIADTLKTIALTELQNTRSDDGELNALKKKLKDKQAAVAREKEKGAQLVKIEGDGKRQYLTGLTMEGKRILILFDRSASMIDDELVNIIRGKYLSASERRKGGKWRWGVSILKWLLAHLPMDSYYQVYAFNDELTSLFPGQAEQWVAAGNKRMMKSMLQNLKKLAPEKGTDLQSALKKANQLSPGPDAIYVVTDGLPTLSPGKSPSGLVTGEERMELFLKAVQKLPVDIPVYAVLLPTKGDPRAAGLFWALSANTGGKFLAPAWDWP